MALIIRSTTNYQISKGHYKKYLRYYIFIANYFHMQVTPIKKRSQINLRHILINRISNSISRIHLSSFSLGMLSVFRPSFDVVSEGRILKKIKLRHCQNNIQDCFTWPRRTDHYIIIIVT